MARAPVHTLLNAKLHSNQWSSGKTFENIFFPKQEKYELLRACSADV